MENKQRSYTGICFHIMDCAIYVYISFKMRFWMKRMPHPMTFSSTLMEDLVFFLCVYFSFSSGNKNSNSELQDISSINRNRET